MAKGEEPTQSTTTKLGPEQEEFFKLALPGVRDFAAKVPTRYGGSQVADFDPYQVTAQNLALGAADPQQRLADSGAQASNYYTSGAIWQPENNPGMRDAIDAAVRPINQQLTETTLPAIRGEAIRTGNFDSSKRQISEGLAARGAAQAAGDVSSRIVQNEYETNVRAQLQAMGMLPQTQALQTTPALTVGGVGDIRQAMSQAEINQAVGNYNFDQYAGISQAKDILGLVQGMPGGTTVSTGNVPSPNPFTTIAGGALTGASLGSAIPGIGTLVGGGVGAAAGALPFLFR